MKKINTNYVLIGIVLALVGYIFISKKLDERERLKYKRELIKNDSLRTSAEGYSLKLENDLNSKRQLNNLLKETNKKMFDYAKQNDQAIRRLTSVVATFKSKKDTLVLNNQQLSVDFILIKKAGL